MLIDPEIKRNADNGRIISVYTGKGLPRHRGRPCRRDCRRYRVASSPGLV